MGITFSAFESTKSWFPTKSWSRTKTVKFHIKHTWSIEDFCVQLNKQISLTENDEKFAPLVSALFSPSGNDQLQFGISLHPCGVDEENQNFVGIYLHLKNWEGKEVQVKFTMSILKANGQVFQSQDDKTNFTELQHHGWSAFIERAELLNNASEILPNDVLTIRCEIDVTYGQAVESSQGKSIRMEHFNDECISQLTRDLSTMLFSNKTSDVIFEVNGKQLPAHRLILAARSPVFKAMFETDCKETNEGKVPIIDVDLKAFKVFLRFLYTGKVTLEENALELLEIADKYDTETLKTLCVEYLISNLTIDSVVPILVKADMHSVKNLKLKAIQFIVSNLASLVETGNWDATLKTRPNLYSEVIRQMAKVSKTTHEPK